MKATNNNAMVTIPSTTLKALKGLLFSNDGVDLSAIIDDMSVGIDNVKKDLLAINMALTFKGLKPILDVEPVSYQYDWQNRYFKFDYVGYSLIEQVVTYHKTVITVNENGTEEEKDMGNIGFGFGVANFEDLLEVKAKVFAYLDKQKASK